MKTAIDTDKRDAATSALGMRWSPKISVKGDYDQFARLPRKEKNRTRDRSPHLPDKLMTSSAAGLLHKTSYDSNSTPMGQNFEEGKVDSKKTTGKELIEEKKSSQIVRNSSVSVTNFPDGPNHGQQTLSRLDSLPPRKQPRIEHMKQLRNEPQDIGLSRGSPRRLPGLDASARFDDGQGLLPPEKQTNREVAFSPPIASVVDFSNSSDADKYSIESLNRTLLAEILRDGQIDPAIMARLSTKFTVGYVKISDFPPSKNVISSMVVRPILPPIKRTRKGIELGEHKHPNRAKQSDPVSLEVTPQERQGEQRSDGIFRWKSTVDMTYHFQRGSRLRQGHSKYVYRPRAHHSTAVLDATTNSPKELLDIGGEIEDDFDRVVRWKSKIRYCGKPVMYKRATSPTLGEEALKRKLTDRLPTRQVHKAWPDPGELYSDLHDRNEYWRRPPSNLHSKLSAPSDDGAGAKAKHAPGAPQNLKQKSTGSLDGGYQHRAHGVSLPPPQIPVRKWKPMWQRMQRNEKFSA